MSETETAAQEIVIPLPADALAFFRDGDATDAGRAEVGKLLDAVHRHIDGFEADVATEPGRKAIKSLAYRIARAKTMIDDAGLEVAREVKALPKQVDATRRIIKTTLEGWQSDVRKPLDDWEAAEEERKAKHVSALAYLDSIAAMTGSHERGDLVNAKEWIDNLSVHEGCEEYIHEYEIKAESARRALSAAISERDQRDADAAELAALRAEKAAKEAEEAEKAAAARAAEEAEAAKRREADIAAEAAARAIREKEDAERQAREAEEASARDRAHQAAIHREIVDGLKTCGIDEDTGRRVVVAMLKGEVPHVAIRY